MTTPLAHGQGTQTPRQRRAFTAWMAVLAILVGVLFAAVTLLTLAVWIGGGRSETNPVVDLAFFGLGGVLVAGGLVTQVRAPERHDAGFQQAATGLVALALAGLAGDRIEPLWGGLVFLAALLLGTLMHPRRRGLAPAVRPPHRGLLAAAVAAAIPACLYAATMLNLARSAGPSCFAGQCARGDRYAEAAALALAVVAVLVLAALRPTGWRLAAGSAAVAAAIVGAASVALPDVAGSLGVAWGLAVLAWAATVVVLAARIQRRTADHP
jgi:hypothetical protein